MQSIHSTAESVSPELGTLSQDVLGMMLQAMQESPAAMVLTDPGGLILRVNKAFEHATGYSAAELQGKNPSMLRSGLQAPTYYKSMWASIARNGRWKGAIWNRRKDGALAQEYLTIVALKEPAGEVAYLLGTYADQNQRSLSRENLRRTALTDPTTGLLGRQAFAQAVDRLCAECESVQVFALDIDGFTELNELYGLESGDAILRQMALRCTEIASGHGGTTIVGRVGPDEFAIALAQREQSAESVHALATRLYAQTQAPFDLGGEQQVRITVSIGLASLTSGGSAAETLLHASTARQSAVPGLQALQSYDVHDAQRKLSLSLREAIHSNQIFVAYQPKVELSTGRLAGVEALARWTLPDGTAIAPSEFIPMAERKGLIGLLSDCVMEQSLRQIASWRDAGLSTPAVAINFSALQFQQQDYVQHLALALDRHQVPASLVELELTESALFGDIDQVMGSLKSFRELGVTLSIDDFGTGYSSLAYLRRFPIQYLKIDRQFVSSMVEDSSACEIVRLIVEMAHRLGLRCIAEGIETPEQLKRLTEMGCDEGQGFLLSRPLDTRDMTQVLSGSARWIGLFPRQVDLDHAGPRAGGADLAIARQNLFAVEPSGCGAHEGLANQAGTKRATGNSLQPIPFAASAKSMPCATG